MGGCVEHKAIEGTREIDEVGPGIPLRQGYGGIAQILNFAW